MPNLKKVVLDPQTQEAIWNLIHTEQDVVVDVFGTEVRLTVVSSVTDDQHEVIREIESDPQLQRMLQESDADEQAGRVYSVDEAIDYIRKLHS